MSDSYIATTRDGTVTGFVGPDATLLVRAITIKNALSLHVKTGGRMRLTRTAKPTHLLAWAGEICGKRYPRGAYEAAMADLTIWIETMKAALPVVER